ncbi:mitogen-activated protein kinase binding protein 1 [Chytriomyces hyalinus]|nr:mitogen-activated protein kinase binding protein 1 [Chytriomyces hyalinus]
MDKKRRANSSNVTLARVLGISAKRGNGLAVGAAQSLCVSYCAGGVAVVLNPAAASVQHVSISSKAVSCVNLSQSVSTACLLAVGETGHNPSISIHDVSENSKIAHITNAHKFGVFSCAFSPTNSQILVSLGVQHDGFINVWMLNLHSPTSNPVKIACTRVSSVNLTSLQFMPSGSAFVTSGFRHFKYWNLDALNIPIAASAVAAPSFNSSVSPTANNAHSSNVPIIDGVFATVGEHKNSTFMDIATFAAETSDGKQQQAYSITDKGILVLFNGERVMEKWVDLKVKGGLSIAICSRFIVCGCTDGIIRLFEPVTMKYIATLPKPHHLGVDVAQSVGARYVSTAPPNAVYPDTVAVKVDIAGEYITSVYSDRSLFIWDVKDVKHVGKFRSYLGHSDCVWGVEMFPNLSDDEYPRPETPYTDSPDAAQSPTVPPHGLPTNSFVTYSSDLTIRFWNLDYTSTWSGNESAGAQRYFRRNIYSKELLKIVYSKKDEYINAVKGNGAESPTTRPNTSEKAGIRTLRVNSNGKWMAAGDRSGNLTMYELDTFTERGTLEAHDGEILAMDFTLGHVDRDLPELLATGSRDRLIHVFNIRWNGVVQLIQTLDEHTSSITGVKFSEGGRKLMSSAADKSIVFRSLQEDLNKPGSASYTPFQNSTGRSTVFDIEIDPATGKHLLSVTQDRRLSLYNAGTGKLLRSHVIDGYSDKDDASSTSSPGGLLKIHLDPSGLYAAVAAADKCIRIVEVATGNVVASMVGHSEVVTGVKFSFDGKWIVSTSSDGCVFVWKCGGTLLKAIEEGVARRRKSGVFSAGKERVDAVSVLLPPSGRGAADAPVNRWAAREDERDGAGVELVRTKSSGSDFMTVFEGDEGLPGWARALKDGKKDDPKLDAAALLPQNGPWATRLEADGVKLFSEVQDASDTPPVARINGLFDRRFSIETSIESLVATVAPASGSDSIPANDVTVVDVDAEETTDVTVPTNGATESEAVESPSKNAETESIVSSESLLAGPIAVQPSVPEETIFAEDRASIEVEPSGDAQPAFTISEAVEIVDDTATSDRESIDQVSIDVVITDNGESEGTDEASNDVGKLEEYLNAPVDESTVRQSISAKHIMSRDPTKRGMGGNKDTTSILVEAVLNKRRLDHATVQPAEAETARSSIDTPTADENTISEMAEKSIIGPELRISLALSPIQMNRTMSAVNREVILEGATVSNEDDDAAESIGHYESEDFENVDDEDGIEEPINAAQVLKDLKRLKSLVDSSASLLKRLESTSKPPNTGEIELSEELKSTLQYVRESASEALKLTATENHEQPDMSAALEKYSNLLVGIVREKLSHPVADQ